MHHCKKCGLPGNYKGIHFDGEGICNYCHFYESHREVLEDSDSLEDYFVSRLEAAKERARAAGADYDCLVGLSGGKDSTFIAYELKHRYHMRVLAFTYDNGFSTDYGRENIAIALEKLDIDHVNFSPRDSELRKYYRMSVSMFHNFCMFCFHLLHYHGHRIALEKKIPLIVNGRSQGQVLQCAAREKLLEPFEQAHSLRDFEYQMFGGLVDKLTRSGVLDLLEGKETESLSYFMYHPYDPEFIMEFLQERLGWVRPAAKAPHADCWAHALAEKLNLDSHGYPIMTGELAVMVRQGKLSQEEAAAMREEDTRQYQEPDPAVVKRFMEKYGVSEQQLRLAKPE